MLDRLLHPGHVLNAGRALATKIGSTGGVHNDKSQAIRCRAKNAAGVATRIPEPPTTKPHPWKSLQNTKPSARRAHRPNRRGFRSPIPAEPAPCPRLWITPLARPRGANQPYTHQEGLETGHNATTEAAPCKCTPPQGKTITSQAIQSGRFEVTTSGRF